MKDTNIPNKQLSGAPKICEGGLLQPTYRGSSQCEYFYQWLICVAIIENAREAAPDPFKPPFDLKSDNAK